MGESSNSGQYQKLPPGWDCKLDQATGNCYYINYFTKAMQLEDPRIRYKQLQNERCSTESIPMQPLHGSPYHVYPSNNLPAIRAFQAGPVSHVHPGWQHMSSSPLLSSRGNLEMSPLPFPKLTAASTQTPRLGNLSRRSTIQETSFSNHMDTDAVVTKIQNMFPTASENHIRLLLRRYYNREAVVISALQVEKHPVTMPGPFVTPPAQRHLFHSNSAFQMTPPSRRLDIGHSVGVCSGTSRTASPLPGGRFGSVISMNSSSRGADGATIHAPNGPIGYNGATNTGAFSTYPATSSVLFHGSPRFGEQWRSSPKPHSSPKMKLRYMKNIFPKADEMLLLDVLAGADNNVQKASQTLISMGYTKRDFLAPKPQNRTEGNVDTDDGNHMHQSHQLGNEQIIPLRPKEYTHEEKEAIQERFKEKYAEIAERIIIMALESVNYSEDRAIQILQIVQEEENVQRAKNAQKTTTKTIVHDSTVDSLATKTAQIDMRNSNTFECNEVDGHLRENAVATHAGTDNIITVVVEENITKKPDDNNGDNDNDNKGTNKIPSNGKNITKTITTSTLSTSSSNSLVPSKNLSKIKKLAFPSINVTTPTTATTQIILSNSPIYVDNEMAITDTQHDDEKSIKKSSTTTERPTENVVHKSLSSSFSTSKSLSPYEKPTTSTTTSTFEPSSTSASSSFKTLTVKSMLARCNKSSRRANISSSSVWSSLSSSSASTNSSSSSSSSKSFSSSSSSRCDAIGTASLREKLKITSRPRDKTDTLKYTQHRHINADGNEVKSNQKQEFKSILGRIATMGQNTELSRGPDESLLLADYVTWNGANPDISVGQRHMAVGSDSSLLSERTYVPHGRNVELCKGPKVGLAKGSIYAQLTAAKSSKSANIKCN